MSTDATLDTLQRALEDHADAMSSAAQILLHGLRPADTAQVLLHELPTDATPQPWRRDVERIQQSAREIYRMVREQLAVKQQPGTASGEELHVLRHDLRGQLQNILGRCQLVIEDGAASAQVLEELRSITDHALACVDVLNHHRNGEPVASERPGTQPLIPLDECASDDAALSMELGVARILVVDDSASSREVLGRFLVAQGHEVVFAETGRQALARVAESDFDLILLDLIMPEMNGFDVLKSLRRSGILRHTFVIIISGMDAGTNTIRGIELGAVDYLARPIDLRLLRARVNACIERQRLRERELAQFFTPTLARQLIRHPEQLAEGRRAEVTVLFCDIVGFSRVSERLGPEATIRWVGAVLSAMSASVMAHDGVLVDFTGDQVMALWGAPSPQPDHADRACRCARDMMAALPALDEVWREAIGQSTDVTIGINTGDAFVGNIGTPQKFKFGVLGNTVNLASRVQSATKFVRARVLLTGTTKASLKSPLASRRLGYVRVNNIAAPVDLHELRVSDDPRVEQLTSSYETALASFELCEMHTASAVLGKVLAEFPHDGPSLLLMSRAVQEMLRDETAVFDSVWTLPGK